MTIEFTMNIVICVLCALYSFAYVVRCVKKKRPRPAVGAGLMGAAALLFATLICLSI